MREAVDRAREVIDADADAAVVLDRAGDTAGLRTAVWVVPPTEDGPFFSPTELLPGAAPRSTQRSHCILSPTDVNMPPLDDAASL